MRDSFRQSMTWLHTWAGLLLGWLLFAIFLTGTATYFRAEITQWMQPELRRQGSAFDAAHAALRRLERDAATSPQWFVDLPDARSPATQVLWRLPDGARRFERATLDARSGENTEARETRGGDFFYRFHFQLQLPHPWGRYLAGIAALFMLVALITGVIAHRRFFADFFTFRSGRPGLRSWLDVHNVVGVLALPFYVMISYSALVIFSAMYLPWGQLLLKAAQEPGALVQKQPAPAAPAAWVPTADLRPMLHQAEALWGLSDLGLRRIEVSDRGTARCTVTLHRAPDPQLAHLAHEQLRFDGVTGARLDALARADGPGTRIHSLLYGLHLARFAGPALRTLFFLMGLMGTALIGTGLVLWTLKRRHLAQTGPRPPGLALVERLNVATLAGLPLACAVLFCANRLLPTGLELRADWEVSCFFYAWAASLLHAFLRPAHRAWREQLWMGAALFALVPLLDVLFAGEFLKQALLEWNTAHLGFDAAMLACSLALLYAANKMRAQGAGRTPLGSTKAMTGTSSVNLHPVP